MHKNFLLALAIVAVTGGGLFATSASALTPPYDAQAQIDRLMAQISELTAQIAKLRGQQVDPSIGVSSSPMSHRICGLLNRNLAAGAEGDDVRGLQEYLYENKLLSVAPTGYFGQMTADAVRKWQSNEGVQAVGSFGPLSRERIKIWCGGGWSNNTERFSASPTRGNAPLTVVFDTWISGYRVNTVSYSIDFGDGTSERAADCNAPADGCISPGQNKHTYSHNGTYTATLNKTTDPCPDDGDPSTPRCMAAIHNEVVAKQQITVGPVACTKEYKPVCGQPYTSCPAGWECQTAIPVTFSNRCEMNAAGASFLYEGQCRDSSVHPANNPQCKTWIDGTTLYERDYPGGPSRMVGVGEFYGVVPPAYCKQYFGTDTNRTPSISSFSGPTTLSVNQSGTWTIKASDPENGQLTYSVTWGDENAHAPVAVSSAAAREFHQSTTFTHSYANAGTYAVAITVRDSAGNEAKSSSAVRVEGSNTVCADIYQPVCGRPAGCANTCGDDTYCTMQCQLHQPQTYGNRCTLNAAGAAYLHEGQCTSTSGNWY